MPQEPASLLHDFPRGDPDRAPLDTDPGGFKPPSASFTKSSLLRSPRLAWQPGKLFLGVADGEVQEDGEGRKFILGGHAVGVHDDRHICTFAGSRAGKGRAAILPNMLHWPGSVLATDPKGELASITARRRVALGQDVHVLDPFGVAKGYPHRHGLVKGFNPIAAMRDGSLVEDAALISDALVVVAPNSKDPHWDESARAFIKGLLLHIRTWPDYEGKGSLLTLREVVGEVGGETSKTLHAAMKLNPAAEGVIKSAAADFFQRPDDERGSVLSSARRHLEFIDLFRETVVGQFTLRTHSFNLSDLKTRPTTIYLCLPARHIGTCNRWLRLFVNLMLQSMEQTRVKALPGGVPVLCVLDEFASLGHMKQIEDAAGQIAGFGVKLWPVLQDLGQLKSLYSERWETFLGNAGIVQFFGNNDLTTLKWLSERLGQTTIQAHSRLAARVVSTDDDSRTRDVSTSQHNLLTAEEAARFFGRDDPRLRQLVIWAGRRMPFLVLQRAYYDKHALFRNEAGEPLFDTVPNG